MKSQSTLILAHLQSGKTLTPIEALNKFGCFRLGARVFQLRKAHPIHTEMVKRGKKFVASYSLKK